MTYEFEIGDNVIYVGFDAPALKDKRGIVRAISTAYGPNPSYAVEFEGFSNGHDCNGKIPSVEGWWCEAEEGTMDEIIRAQPELFD